MPDGSGNGELAWLTCPVSSADATSRVSPPLSTSRENCKPAICKLHAQICFRDVLDVYWEAKGAGGTGT